MRTRTFVFSGLVLAAVSLASLASADPNKPTAHLAISHATSDCKAPGSGPPPSGTGFGCAYSSQQDLPLVLNKPVEATLPDGRTLQVVWTGNDDKGRFKVAASSRKAGASGFIPFATISVRPNEAFGVNFPYAGKPNDAMYVGISIN